MTVVLEPANGVKVVSLEERSHEAPELTTMGANISSAKDC
jgi:hypothetical protein